MKRNTAGSKSRVTREENPEPRLARGMPRLYQARVAVAVAGFLRVAESGGPYRLSVV